MSFDSLLPAEHKERKLSHAKAKLLTIGSSASTNNSIEIGKRGCEFCPLDKIHGVNKIFGKVRGKDIFVWAQSPGAQENKAKEELVGPSGKWLWYELRRVGIKRKHCDVQNAVRCWPVDVQTGVWPPFKMRPPSKLEIKCCSLFNDKAIEKSKAKLHLVFGQVAAASVLKKEFKKDQRIWFSDTLKAWVVYLDHPSYFVRMGYIAGDGKPANAPLQRFRDDLQKAKQLLKKNSFDRYGFLKEQKYIGVTRTKQSNEVYQLLKKKAKEGHRLIADMESGKVTKYKEGYDPDEKGTYSALCCGFAYKPGTTYTFALKHPGSGISSSAYKTNLRNVRSLLNDSKISKGFHYGISDTTSIRELLHTDTRGYDYDTLLGEYFRDPNAKKYGLAAIAERRYPEFIDYKSIEGPESFTPDFREVLKEKKYAKLSLPQQVMLGRKKQGALNLARMPWEKMVIYNGADCHLEKLVEQDTKKYVNPPLMQVYIDAAYVLHRMETDKGCKPLFDYTWHPKVAKLLKLRRRRLKKQIFALSGKYAYIPYKKDRPQWIAYLDGKDKKPEEVRKVKFNPGSPDHVMWLLWDKLGYNFTPKDKGDKPNTRASTLLTLALKHKKAKLIVLYRQTTKAEGTYSKGYLKCADLNDGHLRTNWKQTGTSTGRFSSGKNQDKKDDAVINFQNIHGDELIKCLLISDRRWRKIYKYWLNHGPFTKHNWKQFGRLYVDIGFDFSQNELRELAEESGDKNLIKAFSTKKKWYCKKCKTLHKSDPHVEVGHDLTGWPKEDIAHNDHIRKLVKNMQFGLVFGLQGEGLFSFITMLGVKTTLEEVNKYHAKYFRKYKGVKKLQEAYRAFVRKHGYVKNIFGFRRKLNVNEQVDPTIFLDEERKGGAYWGNQAINTPIQGASHQLLVMAIAALHRYRKVYKLLKYPNKEVHDALYFRQKLIYLFKTIKQGLRLLLDEPIKIVNKDFGLKKKVLLSAKPKAGFRLGVEIELEDINTEWDFLNKWCQENKLLEASYKKQLHELHN